MDPWIYLKGCRPRYETGAGQGATATLRGETAHTGPILPVKSGLARPGKPCGRQISGRKIRRPRPSVRASVFELMEKNAIDGLTLRFVSFGGG